MKTFRVYTAFNWLLERIFYFVILKYCILTLHRSLSLIYILGIMHSMQIRRSYAYSSMGHWHVKIFLQNDAYHWITYKHKVNADPAHKAIRWLLRERVSYISLSLEQNIIKRQRWIMMWLVFTSDSWQVA